AREKAARKGAGGDAERIQAPRRFDRGGDMSYGSEAKPRVGFFTDTSLCIGCKACEVACKEWNQVPEDGIEWLGNSYDHTGGLGADTWRHVALVEQKVSQPDGEGGLAWLRSSGVCTHRTHAAC